MFSIAKLSAAKTSAAACTAVLAAAATGSAAMRQRLYKPDQFLGRQSAVNPAEALG